MPGSAPVHTLPPNCTGAPISTVNPDIDEGSAVEALGTDDANLQLGRAAIDAHHLVELALRGEDNPEALVRAAAIDHQDCRLTVARHVPADPLGIQSAQGTGDLDRT